MAWPSRLPTTSASVGYSQGEALIPPFSAVMFTPGAI